MLINKFKQLLSSKYLRNAGWLGSAELANRVFRLGTTVTLARVFSPEDYGLMAIIYTIFEFGNVFTVRGGIGSKIVQTKQEYLQAVCNTSYWLNWMLCGAVFLIQCLAAFPIAWFYGNNQLILPISVVAIKYLMFPLILVQIALIERENRLKIIAICNAMQSLVANIAIIILALLGMGIWAIVWPILLTSPVTMIIIWRNHSWQPPKSFSLEKWQEIVRFGRNILGVELLNKLRMNLDYLLVGKFLGLEELGIYYFAFNAGSGITMNVTNVFMSALFPHLCAVRHHYQQFKKQYFSSLKTTFLVVVPIVTLQSLLAPLYVPIVFGQKWVVGIPILILICLSVLPKTFKWASMLLLNAVDKPQINLYSDIIVTVIFSIILLIAVQWGVYWLAASVLISQLLMHTIFGVWTIKYVFTKDRFMSFY